MVFRAMKKKTESTLGLVRFMSKIIFPGVEARLMGLMRFANETVDSYS